LSHGWGGDDRHTLSPRIFSGIFIAAKFFQRDAHDKIQSAAFVHVAAHLLALRAFTAEFVTAEVFRLPTTTTHAHFLTHRIACFPDMVIIRLVSPPWAAI